MAHLSPVEPHLRVTPPTEVAEIALRCSEGPSVGCGALFEAGARSAIVLSPAFAATCPALCGGLTDKPRLIERKAPNPEHRLSQRLRHPIFTVTGSLR